MRPGAQGTTTKMETTKKPKYFWPEDLGKVQSFFEIPVVADVAKEALGKEWIRVHLGREREPEGFGVVLQGYEPWGVYRIGLGGLRIEDFIQRLQLDMAYGIVNETLDFVDIACFIDIPSPEGHGNFKNRTKYTIGYSTNEETKARSRDRKRLRRAQDREWAQRERNRDRIRKGVRNPRL